MDCGEYKLKDEDYFKLDFISHSGLESLRSQSAAHFKYSKDNPVNNDKEAFAMGRAVHCLVLEPEEEFNRFVVIPADSDRRTKVGKEKHQLMLKSAAGKQLIKQKDLQLARDIANAVKQDEDAGVYLQAPGQNEKCFIWQSETGVVCKSKLDRYIHDACVLELKTTQDASPDAFLRDVLRYGYHRQMAFYLDAYNFTHDNFINDGKFIVVEKTAPFIVQVYKLSPELIDLGRKEYLEDLEFYSACKQENVWPKYFKGVQELGNPSWNTGYEFTEKEITTNKEETQNGI